MLFADMIAPGRRFPPPWRNRRRKKPTVRTGGLYKLRRQERDYFTWLEMLLNVVLRLVPRVF
jgi:hypothetical protein